MTIIVSMLLYKYRQSTKLKSLHKDKGLSKMTKTKKYLLTNIIVEKCKTLASVEITLKDELILSNFIEKRLQLHGRNGYMFHDDGWSIPVNDDLSIQRVGFSVLASNHILNIFNR